MGTALEFRACSCSFTCCSPFSYAIAVNSTYISNVFWNNHIQLLCERTSKDRRSCSSVKSLPVGSFVKGQLRGTRETALRAVWGRMAKPTFVELEPITGEDRFSEVMNEAQQRNQPVVIDWVAAWCRKCIYLKPKLEKLAAEFHPEIKFFLVDVNTVPQSLIKRAEVTKMPTIQLWQNNQKKAEVIGGHKAWLVLDEVREMIHGNQE